MSTRFDDLEATMPPCKPAKLGRRLVIAVIVALSAVLMCAGGVVPAYAQTEGPFEVSGPTGSYQWDGTTLTVSDNGVTVAGSPSTTTSGNISLGSSVSSITLGPDVFVGTLTASDSIVVTLAGGDNRVTSWSASRDSVITGSGTISIGSSSNPLSLRSSVRGIVEGAVDSLAVWDTAVLVLEPTADLQSVITAFGGTVDASALSVGAPLPIVGVSIGNSQGVVSLIAPFGAIALSDILKSDSLFVNGTVDVYENQELIGTMLSDGSFDITATRPVTFVGWNGNVLEIQNVPLFGGATAPDAVAPEGYRFVGWDTEFSRVIAPLTVTALFEPTGAATPGESSDSASTTDGVVASGVAPLMPLGSVSHLAKTGDAAGCVARALILATVLSACIAVGCANGLRKASQRNKNV